VSANTLIELSGAPVWCLVQARAVAFGEAKWMQWCISRLSNAGVGILRQEEISQPLSDALWKGWNAAAAAFSQLRQPSKGT
jgi:hypothetical protein